MNERVNQQSVTAAERALAAHAEALGGIEGDASIQVWHLLASLQEYCVANAVDLDTELRQVRESLSNGDLALPASAAYINSQSRTRAPQ